MFENKALKNVGLLISGTIVSQALPFVFSPLLTRLYLPEEFGFFATYFAFSMILSVLATLRYEMAVILPDNKVDINALLQLSVVISITIAAILSLTSLGLYLSIGSLAVGGIDILDYIWLLALSTFSIGSFQASSYWCNKHELYGFISYSRIARALNTVVWSIVLGLFKVKGGLIIADTIGQLLSSAILLYRIYRKDNTVLSFDINAIKFNLKKYAHFPIYNVPSGLLEKISGQAPTLIFTKVMGSATVGLYSLSQRVIGAPSGIVARSIGDVFRQKAVLSYIENKNCRALFLSTLKRLVMISVVPFLVFIFIAPTLFQLIFGEQWYIAGQYAQLLGPMFLLQFIVSPLSSMFLVAQKQRIDMIIQIFLITSIVIGLYITAYQMKSITISLMVLSTIYSIKYLVELYLSYQFSLGNKK